MGIIIDILIIAFVLLSVYLGYKKGLVALAISLFSFIIAIVIAVALYRPIGNLIINVTSIDETIENAILEKATEAMHKEGREPNKLIETAEKGMLPSTARNLSVNIVYAGVMVILFVGSRIVLIFIKAIANVIAKLPIIAQLNKAGGILYGLVRGILLVYLILLIVGLFGTINPGNVADKAIEQTTLTKIMYENNIYNVFFNK